MKLGRPYFSRAEKQQFLNKWKEKNIQEDIEEISTPVFSLKNFNKDPEEVEYEHLLSLIKDPLDRRWILASIDQRLPIRKKIKQLEQYIQYLKEGQDLLSENEELIQNQVVDLNQKVFSESFLRTFGWMIEKLLQRMFGRRFFFTYFDKRKTRSNTSFNIGPTKRKRIYSRL